MPPYRKTKILLGSGNFAVVYVAEDPDGAKLYAWKELKEPVANPDDAQRFIKEVHVLATLKHPNIVPVLYSSLQASPMHFVMPRASKNLATAVRFSEVVDREDVYRQICWGVEYAHDNGVLHRDLKTDNILLFDDGSVKVSDFGLAKKLDASSVALTDTNMVGGTHGFTAPEQWSDSMKKVTEATDIYSLGKILYVLYTGLNPYHVEFDHENLPDGVKYVIQKATATKPEDRFGSVAELLDSYDQAVSQDDVYSEPELRVKSLIQKFFKSGRLNTSQLKILDNIFVECVNDAAFYLTTFPLIPVEVWIQLYDCDRLAFRRIFDIYDGFVSGDLPFSYTDKVATGYAGIYRNLNDADVSVVVLNRLLSMGHRHNRWYVRQVLEGLVKHKPIDGLVGFRLRDIVKQNIHAAEWSFENVQHDKLPNMVVAELKNAAG